MEKNYILIRYGELALKGKNQKDFIRQLMRNIKKKLKGLTTTLMRQQGRLFIAYREEEKEVLLTRREDIFGIVGFSPCVMVRNDMEEIENEVRKLVEKTSFHTFKVVTKRADKRFKIGSQEMNQRFGSFILSQKENIRVDVHQPEFIVHIEVRDSGTYVYGNSLEGLGGLPVGVSGKVMLFLSGGIDSPVAGYCALKRGVTLTCIHFHSFPYTSMRARQKVIDLVKHLTRYQGEIQLTMVPFTDVQLEIKRACQESYLVTIMRRMMVRIAEEVLTQKNAKAFVTGENLGQVASQTLEGLQATNEVTNQLILRPLIGMDKQDIISISKKIETYETSILPYEDCCTVFLPKNPKTKPKEEDILKEEKNLDIQRLVDEAVSKIEILTIEESYNEDKENEDIF